jgi:hypothetical protein
MRGSISIAKVRVARGLRTWSLGWSQRLPAPLKRPSRLEPLPGSQIPAESLLPNGSPKADRPWENESPMNAAIPQRSRDPARHAALHAAPAQPDLHGHHAGQAAACADRAEEGTGHCRPQ